MTVQVYKESSKRALDEQFGGEDETPPPPPGFTAPTLKLTKYSNAYMLVYVRQSSWKDIMLEVKESDIADHVRSRLEVGFPCSTFELLCGLIALCVSTPTRNVCPAISSANTIRMLGKCHSRTSASRQSKLGRANKEEEQPVLNCWPGMMQAEKAEKEKKKKEKQEAHLYTIIKVVRDQDMSSQIGSTQFFDLVDHDKVQLWLSSQLQTGLVGTALFHFKQLTQCHCLSWLLTNVTPLYVRHVDTCKAAKWCAYVVVHLRPLDERMATLPVRNLTWKRMSSIEDNALLSARCFPAG